MPIQLYAFDTPNGRKICVALEEMELPYDIRIIDIGRDEQIAGTGTTPRFWSNPRIRRILNPIYNKYRALIPPLRTCFRR